MNIVFPTLIKTVSIYMYAVRVLYTDRWFVEWLPFPSQWRGRTQAVSPCRALIPSVQGGFFQLRHFCISQEPWLKGR